MKLIFHDKMTCIILTFSLLLFLFIINSLSFGAQERSNLPIGLLNLDHSESAEQLVESMKKVSTLYIYEGDMGSLNKLLIEEQIGAFFVIEEGYEKSIQSGQTSELITMYYTKNNENAKIISDIFAGEMLYKINLYKGYNVYKSIQKDTQSFSEQEYMEYAQAQTESTEFDFAFNISLVNVVRNQEIGDNLSNSVIYQQIIWGILGMLLSFVAMFMAMGIVLDKEMGLDKRIGISFLKTSVIDVSYLSTMITVLSFFSLLLCLVIGGKIQHFTFLKGCSLYLLMLLFSLVIGLWFIMLGKVIRQAGKYQIIGAVSILIFGFLGFCNIIEGFVSNNLLNISKITPNNWFIQGFTDIILFESLQDIPFFAHVKLAITAVCLILLNGLIGQRQNR